MAELHETINNHDRRLRQLETKTVASTGGVQGTAGTNGTNGTNGAQGDKGGIRYSFSTTTTMADPSVGVIRFNSATFGSITAIAIDDLDENSVDVSAYILSWDDSGTSLDRGTIEIKSNVNGTAQVALFRLTALTDNAGWTQLTVAPLSGSVPADAAELVVSFHRTGLQGLTGLQGFTGLQGTTGTTPSQITVIGTAPTDTTMFPVIVANNATGAQDAFIDSTYLKYNSSTGALTLGDGSSVGSLRTGGRSNDTMTASNWGVIVSETGAVYASAQNTAVLFIQRGATSGNIMQLYDDDTNIATVSFNTSGAVTWGTFCGAHWSQIDGFEPDSVLLGTVVETTGELCFWEGETNNHLPKVKISDSVGSKNVYGVFSHIDLADELKDLFIASVGAFFVRISQNVTVNIGDLLESNGDGCAKVQDNDFIKSSTIGKVTSTTVYKTYEDGSYVVPCVLYCG